MSSPAGTPFQRPSVFRPDELPAHERGNGARTIPLVTAARGATTYLTGITKFPPGSRISHHIHNVAESVMVIKGEAVVDIDGKLTRLHTYDTTFVPANIAHHFENASTDAEMWILWIYGSLEATRTIVRNGEYGRIDAESNSGATSVSIVREIAEIEVKPGREADFEAAVAAAAPLFQSAQGARTMSLDRSEEHPQRYRLVVGWETVDDHVVRFRESPQFLAWRELIGEHITALPRVEHVRNVLTAF
jgi:quercetin dioxygenase-like cupin family protein/heme-degrading monooxygenase HmoA